MTAALAMVAVASAVATARIDQSHGGFDLSRLARIRGVVQRHVDEKRLPGAVVLLARQGRVAMLEAFGAADLESARPMRPDALARLASASKIVTSVGLLILYEEGRFALGDPVGTHLPPLKALSVRNASGDIVPAMRPLTIRDLLRHTTGYGYGNDRHQRSAYEAAGLMRVGPVEDWTHAFSLEEWVERLARVPLDAEPGTRFEYGLGADVAGALIERLSGRPLDAFLRERIFAPLEMRDTGFVVDAADLNRLTSVYAADGAGWRRIDSGETSAFRVRPRALSGGGGWDMLGNGGLVSTAPDLFRLLQMLLNGGVLGRTRLLSRHTVDLMFTNQLAGLAAPERQPGIGFGFGYAILNDPARAGEVGTRGMIWWAGSTNTRYWIDRERRDRHLSVTGTTVPLPRSDEHGHAPGRSGCRLTAGRVVTKLRLQPPISRRLLNLHSSAARRLTRWMCAFEPAPDTLAGLGGSLSQFDGPPSIRCPRQKRE